MLDGVSALLDKLSHIPGIGSKIAGVAEAARNEAGAIRAGIGSDAGAGTDLVSGAVKGAEDRQANIPKDMQDAAQAGAATGSQAFDVGSVQDAMNKQIGDVMDHVGQIGQSTLAKFPAPKGKGGVGEEELPIIDADKLTKSKEDKEKDKDKDRPIASALQKIGGGGGVWNGSKNGNGEYPGADAHNKSHAVLEQSRRLLEDISKTLKKESPKATGGNVGVFAYP